ncbi:MAG: crossover junction endodeoxyribonuclease RuvC [Candidatus Kapaibacteriales bacterium]
MIVLGVDPGSVKCGYGILKVDNQNLLVVDFGIIYPKKNSNNFIGRLKVIYDKIALLIQTYFVDEAVFETHFYAKNPQSLLKLSQARTSAILAAINLKLPIFEYSPKQIKLAVTGKGNAPKKSVSYMISKLLNLELSNSKYDVSDALAVAYCHIVRHHLPKTNKTFPQSWEKYFELYPERFTQI